MRWPGGSARSPPKETDGPTTRGDDNSIGAHDWRESVTAVTLHRDISVLFIAGI